MTWLAAGPHRDGVAPDGDDPAQNWPDRLAARADDRLTALGLRTPFQRDGALALVVFLITGVLLAVLFADPGLTGGLGLDPSDATAVIVVLLAQALMLGVRRVSPVLCLWSMTLLQVVLLAVVPGGGTIRGVAPFVAAYTCGALLPARRATRAVVGVAVLESVALAVASLTGLAAAPSLASGELASGSMGAAVIGQLLSSLFTYAVAAVVGAYVMTRRRYVDLLRVRAAEAVQAQQARTEAAIRAERSRMARELHDIAAHHLSGMVVQAAVVERLIDRDPGAAKEAAAWVRGQGKETLHNLRLVVGALREPESREVGDGGSDVSGGGGAPVPGLAELDRLVGTARDLGTPVDLVREGRWRELPPIADVTFYRVAQEALSNAREHAPHAPVRVALRHGESEVSIEVVNHAGPEARGGVGARPDGHRGFGLIGMEERAQMLGARFDFGPTDSGGWRVAMILPSDGPGSEVAR